MISKKVKKCFTHFASNYMQSMAINAIQAIIQSMTCKSYSSCQLKIEKANELTRLLKANTYPNDQIEKLLEEFMRSEAPIIHRWNSQGISTLDLITKQTTTYPALLKSESDSISFNGRVFFFNAVVQGGLSEMDFEHKELVAKQNAHYQKTFMGICECDQFLFSIGGQLKPGCVSQISVKYDVKSNKWINLPNLKTGRAENCAVQFDYQWIYTLCGINSEYKFVKRIEMLSIKHPTSWQEIVAKPDQSINILMAQALPISSSDILIFGSTTGNYKFHIFDNKYELLSYGYFCDQSELIFTSIPILYKGKIYAVG